MFFLGREGVTRGSGLLLPGDLGIQWEVLSQTFFYIHIYFVLLVYLKFWWLLWVILSKVFGNPCE